jgi:hypothetical protein
MKTTIASLLALAAASVAVAQGTLEFTVSMDGTRALPPNATFWKGYGTFTLGSASVFQGDLFIEAANGQGSVTIYSSPSPDALGTAVFTLGAGPIHNPIPPLDPGGQDFSADRTLTPAERSDLLAGNWWALYSVPGSPESQLRGQIVVPEPSTGALLATGAVAVWSYGRRKRTG